MHNLFFIYTPSLREESADITVSIHAETTSVDKINGRASAHAQYGTSSREARPMHGVFYIGNGIDCCVVTALGYWCSTD